MNTIKVKQTQVLFFLRPSRGTSSFYVILFSFTLLKKNYFMIFHVFLNSATCVVSCYMQHFARRA